MSIVQPTTRHNAMIVNDINKMFPPTHPEWPIAFERSDGRLCVSGETTAVETIQGEEFHILVCDYYNAPKSWEFGVHPRLTAYLASKGMYAEWETCGCVCLWNIY